MENEPDTAQDSTPAQDDSALDIFFTKYNEIFEQEPSETGASSHSPLAHRKARIPAFKLERKHQKTALAEARTLAYTALLKKYNESRNTQENRILWRQVNVLGWPAKVVTKSRRFWTLKDVKCILRNMDRIRFTLAGKQENNSNDRSDFIDDSDSTDDTLPSVTSSIAPQLKQEQEEIHAALLQKYNDSRPDKKPVTRIPWENVQVNNWPENVTRYRQWSQAEINSIRANLPKITFDKPEFKKDHPMPNGERYKINSDLYNELLQTILDLDLLHLVRFKGDNAEKVIWSQLFSQYPQFKNVHKYPRDWSSKDREIIRSIINHLRQNLGKEDNINTPSAVVE